MIWIVVSFLTGIAVGGLVMYWLARSAQEVEIDVEIKVMSDGIKISDEPDEKSHNNFYEIL